MKMSNLITNHNMPNRTANIDYLCVITENGGRTHFKTIDIPESADLVSKLEGLTKNENATVLDLQSQMNIAFSSNDRSPINYVSPFAYADSYIEITTYPGTLSFGEYSELISQKNDALREEFSKRHESMQVNEPARFQEALNSYIESECAKYKTALKKRYLTIAKRYICAKNYTKTLIKAKGQDDVKMYSTDTLGWSNFSYRVTEDITINLGTNFGYGSASYFRLCLRYKGIDILPYSYMVKYYYANRRDLLRYTRLYDVSHDSWNIAFSFVEETANLAASSAEEFVRTWILNEVREMVYGLQGMLEEPDSYIHDLLENADKRTDCDFLSVRNMTWTEKNRFGAYPAEMSLAVRAEKVTGALDFLENLASLADTLPEINTSIEDIKAMAVSILPEIKTMIDKLTKEVALLQEKKAAKEVILSIIKHILEPHEKNIDALYEKRGEDKKWTPRSEFEEQYAKSHKEYEEKKTEESELSSEISKISTEIQMRSSFRSDLQECVDRVCSAGLAESEKTAA